MESTYVRNSDAADISLLMSLQTIVYVGRVCPGTPGYTCDLVNDNNPTFCEKCSPFAIHSVDLFNTDCRRPSLKWLLRSLYVTIQRVDHRQRVCGGWRLVKRTLHTALLCLALTMQATVPTWATLLCVGCSPLPILRARRLHTRPWMRVVPWLNELSSTRVSLTLFTFGVTHTLPPRQPIPLL